ncbi:MAG: tRNA lysidine(34) synthetase TilS [Chlamydiales bacterium]|nr:tRNA lysidine(34) synthetase TilS [Chlamydiia bacterium]MCP5508451.1 tRNA lysidine(34) synthetase TilS [Chlamydiales bacterium]
MNSIENIVREFLRTYHAENKQLLLGLSGGPDSLLLFHLFDSMQIPFAVAHIDHGWRQGSGREAKILREMVEEKGYRFHFLRLSSSEGNSEDEARQERRAFFTELCRVWGYQAVVLGHHADDQAETVLKRILEGANLTAMGALVPAVNHGKLAIWRPLLHVRKRDILSWLKEHEYVPFDDHTNRDPKFLRSRMRMTVIPNLEQQFGKQVAGSLVRVGEEAQELANYLDRRISDVLQYLRQGPIGAYIDTSEAGVLDPYEVRYLIRKVASLEKITLSRAALATATEHLVKGAANKESVSGSRRVYVDRGVIFALAMPIPSCEPISFSSPGVYRTGAWELEVKEGDEYRKTDWRDLWMGNGTVTVPADAYCVALPVMNEEFAGKASISKWWSDHKVPCFLRKKVPVLWGEQGIVAEWMTGKNRQREKKDDWIVNIKLLKYK